LALRQQSLSFRSRGVIFSIDPSPAKTKALLRNAKFLRPLPQGERISVTLFTNSLGYNPSAAGTDFSEIGKNIA
jgi:hypothetical protein